MLLLVFKLDSGVVTLEDFELALGNARLPDPEPLPEVLQLLVVLSALGIARVALVLKLRDARVITLEHLRSLNVRTYALPLGKKKLRQPCSRQTCLVRGRGENL